MRCLEASELMSLRLDSDLPPQEECALQQHLSTCGSCRAEWQSMQSSCALFDDVRFATPPPELWSRVMANIRRHELRLGILRNGVVLVLGVVILAALGLSFWTMASSPLGAILSNPPLISAIASMVVGLVDIVGTLLRAAGLVVKTILACPSSLGLVGYVAIAGALALWWVRLVSGRTRFALRRRIP